jgi:Flp pilus assembly protein TadB
MAQTKRKRRTKHRGNAAGTVEVRGRTGRPLSADEKKKQARTDAREARLNKQPTWESATKRAGLASAFIFLFLLVTSHGKVIAAVIFGVLAFALYVPSGFYLETYLWRRRQRKRQAPR